MNLTQHEFIEWIVFGTATIVIIPFTGGLFLRWGARWLGTGSFSFRRGWMAYLSAYLIATALCALLTMLLLHGSSRWTDWDWALVGVVALTVHVLVIPRILRLPLRKSLPIQGIAYLLNVLVVAAMVIPMVFFFVLPAARRAERMANLHSLAFAMNQSGNRLPPAAIYSRTGQPLLSWRVALLPQLGEEALYQQFKLDEPWDSPHNIALLPRMPKIYAPIGVTAAPNTTHYRIFVTAKSWANDHPRSAFIEGDREGWPLSNISDGPGMTLLIVEAADAVPWTKPEELEFHGERPLAKLGPSPGDRFLAAFIDGHVESISSGVAQEKLRAAITVDGAEATEVLE
jgi:hypothetical protein